MISHLNYPLINAVGGIDYARQIKQFRGVARPERYFDLDNKRYTVECPPRWVKLNDLELEIAEYSCGEKNNWVQPKIGGYVETPTGAIGKVRKFYHQYGIIWCLVEYKNGSTDKIDGVRRSGYIEGIKYLPDYNPDPNPEPDFVQPDDDDDEYDYRLGLREELNEMYSKLSDGSKSLVNSLIDHLHNLEN